MSGGANGAAEGRALELPRYTLDVQAIDLGPGVKAVGLELVETENREPVTGAGAADMWAAVFPALAGDEPWTVDFFSHLERVLPQSFAVLPGLHLDPGACHTNTQKEASGQANQPARHAPASGQIA